jgi:proline iminopeptidase
MKLILLAFLAATATAQPVTSSTAPREGFVNVPGGRAWYRILGSGSETPLLLVHGGPGMGSCYLSDLASRLSKDRPVILYDQLESGQSDHPADRSQWTLNHFVAELAAVRQALKLDRVHLYGHSWGATLVAEYLLTQRPTGIESVTFAGPLLSTPRWIADAQILRAQLPTSVRQTLAQHERQGTTNSPEYLEATGLYYSRFVFRRQPVRMPPGCAFNQAIYEHMWGPNEFTASGKLKDFDRTSRLAELKVPVLFLVGRFDEARVETVTAFQHSVPGAKLEIINNAGHMAMTDEPAAYAQALRRFLSQ